MGPFGFRNLRRVYLDLLLETVFRAFQYVSRLLMCSTYIMHNIKRSSLKGTLSRSLLNAIGKKISSFQILKVNLKLARSLSLEEKKETEYKWISFLFTNAYWSRNKNAIKYYCCNHVHWNIWNKMLIKSINCPELT